MGVAETLDLTPEQRRILTSLLQQFIPGVAVWAYGSRVKWTARPNSDLDLVAFTTPSQSAAVSDLKEALAESNLPFPVDLHVWDNVPERFREIIRKEYVVLQEAKQPESKPSMPGEWPEVTTFATLIEEGALEIGDGYRAKNEELGGDGLIFLRAGHVTDSHIDFTGVEYFHTALEARVRSKLSMPGDAVVTTKGNSIGRTTFVTSSMPPFVYSPHLSYWRSKDRNRIEGGFLRYWSKGSEFSEQLSGMKASTDMAPYLSLIDQKRLRISLPPIEEQRAIAHILGALDDKIELNRKMNETLGAMARALFKSWFVDFEPVRAKAAGRDTGLPRHIADLFSSHLVDSDLGKIPEGWNVEPLDRVLVLQRGFDLPATQRTSGTYPVLAASGPSGTHNEFMVRGPGVTTGRSGVLGKVFYVHDDFWPLNTTLWVKEFRHSTPAYAFHLLHGLDFGLFNAGSAVPTLNRNHVHNLLTLLPPMGLIRAFERIAAANLMRQKHNVYQSQTVVSVRDALLPKLISGELRVKDAERFVEAAT